MLDASLLDRWWAEWIALFPPEPPWNPYGASLVLAAAFAVAFWLLGLARSWLFGGSKRPVDHGLDE